MRSVIPSGGEPSAAAVEQRHFGQYIAIDVETRVQENRARCFRATLDFRHLVATASSLRVRQQQSVKAYHSGTISDGRGSGKQGGILSIQCCRNKLMRVTCIVWRRLRA